MSKGVETNAISIDSMKLRHLGNSYGFTVCKDAIAELELLDDNGELIDDDISVRSIVFDDGTVRYQIPVEDLVDD